MAHKYLKPLYSILVIVWVNSLNGQFAPEKNYLYSSYTGLNSDSEIFNDVSLNSFELLSTNVQFSKDGDLQKVVFAPFKLLDLDSLNQQRHNFLLNSKVNFAQKNGISTIGIGFTWDNSLPDTKRGDRIFQSYSNKVAKIKESINQNLKELLKSDLTKFQEGELDFLLSPQMINDINNIIANIEVRPVSFFLIPKTRAEYRKEEGYNYEDFLYYKKIYESYNKKTKEKLDKELTNEFYKSLLENSFKVTFGGNISLFNIFGGDDVDLDNDGENDNEHSLQQQNLSLGITHIVSEVFGYSLTGYLLDKRGAAEAGNSLSPYYGFSASFGFRTWILNKEYKETKEYLESLFVPSISTGLSFEYLRCNDNEKENCADGILWQYSFTPFIEFKINPKNQFRLGVPINRLNQLDSEQNEVGPFLQWRLQLSGNN